GREPAPDLALEFRATGLNRQRERLALTSEVFRELLHGAVEHSVCALFMLFIRQVTIALDGQRGDRLAVAGEFETADRAVDAAEERGDGVLWHGSRLAAASDTEGAQGLTGGMR